ncbi:MAG: alpha/beta fold hydrolase [Anaerolineae bacterium]|nr:alpha/beta fold hydrolase [Anaerolineae bacterium]
MPKIAANGIELYYELHGPPEADVLVLSNGVLMSTSSWAFQVPVLSKHYRVLLYDCRGMWQSDHPAGPYSMALHADDLAALLDALEIPRAHLVGISYGAEVSMAFALQYPERTRSLVLSSAVSHVDPLLAGWMSGWIAATRARDPEMLFDVTYPLNFSEAWIAANPAALAAARERYAALDFDALLELLLGFSRLNLTAELHKIAAPTLVLVGEEDILKPRKYAEIIAREIPEADFVVVPRAGHAVCWEQPRAFNALILGFLAQVGPVR